MRDIFKRVTNGIICLDVIACIIGLIMVFSPDMSLKTIGVIAAIYIILQGIILIILDIKASKFYIPFDGMISGILSIVIGILLLGKPGILAFIFSIVIGVWIILSSIGTIRASFTIREYNSSWFWLLIISVLDLIAGLIVIFNPFEASISIIVFCGIMIIVHSIISIIDMFVVKRDVNSIEDAIMSKLKLMKK